MGLAAAVTTLIGSDAFLNKGGLTPPALQPIAKPIQDASQLPRRALGRPDLRTEGSPVANPDIKVGQTQEEIDAQARVAMANRKKSYQNMGRSSTILTGPQGVTGAGPGQGPGAQKTLLGY
jgi:hypothetical protein